jgi:amino acid adenylation domain-containing protein
VTARTIDDDLRAQAARDGAATAIVAGARRMSYAELDHLVDRFAAGLRDLGVQRGDRVAIVLPNRVETAIAVYGVLRAGAAFTPLNPTAGADRLHQQIAAAGAVAAVCDAARVETLRAAPLSHVIDVDDGPFGADGPVPRGALDVDLGSIIYTSGSTGEPKGAAFAHRNMRFVTGSIAEYLELSERDRVLCVLPLSFTYGLYQLLICLHAGATLVLEPGMTLPGRLVELLERERITGLPGVPTVFQLLLTLRGLADRELPELRFLTNAGAALPTTTLQALRRTFPHARLYSMYGLTECKRVCYLPPDQLDARPTSVGVPIPGTEAWIEDEHGEEVPAGEVGELVVRGDHVMQGYWNDPALTARKLRPGRWPWEHVLRTGDLFRRDEEGYLYFVGRTDDIIKSRGEKVAPREIEEVLYDAPGVREAAVVGVPDPLLGQAVHAHVCPLEGHVLDPAALRRHCAERLEDFKVPRKVIVCDALPKTLNGKIDKRALAEAA